jgi:hypothetical protein
MDTLARSYTQVVSAIASCGGGDDFVQQHCCVTVCDNNGNPTGVEVVECFEPDDEGEEEKKLLHDKPTFNDEPLLRQAVLQMTEPEIKTLFHNLPASNVMFDKLVDAFLAFEGALDDAPSST